MKYLLKALIFILVLTECSQSQSQSPTATTVEQNKQTKDLINPQGNTIATRILTPDGYHREHHSRNSFAYYLSHLKLKPHGAKARYYNGDTKSSEGVYIAVVDMDIGNRNLQQCADAVMRLRGEYLYGTDQYDDIHFNFTNGFRVDYSKWKNGYRVAVNGNRTHWVKTASPSNSYTNFRKYMNTVFAYAGTLSLSKELVSVPLEDIQIGDVFIHGGTPGHSEIIVDMAKNANGDKIFLLAQSYMPAQETQILINPNNDKISPWYAMKEIGQELYTPQYTFKRTELKRFAD